MREGKGPFRILSPKNPKINLEGKTPSNGRREDPAALPPLLGRGMKPRPATKGHIRRSSKSVLFL